MAIASRYRHACIAPTDALGRAHPVHRLRRLEWVSLARWPTSGRLDGTGGIPAQELEADRLVERTDQNRVEERRRSRRRRHTAGARRRLARRPHQPTTRPVARQEVANVGGPELRERQAADGRLDPGVDVRPIPRDGRVGPARLLLGADPVVEVHPSDAGIPPHVPPLVVAIELGAEEALRLFSSRRVGRDVDGLALARGRVARVEDDVPVAARPLLHKACAYG